MAKENTSPVVLSPRRLQDGGEIVMYRPDDTVQLEVRVDDDSVWLTQRQMGLLFNATPQNITMHIRNIYREAELEKMATCKDFLQVQQEGYRMVNHMTAFYNTESSTRSHQHAVNTA